MTEANPNSLAPQNKETPRAPKVGLALRTAIIISIILGWAVILTRVFLFQPFSITSESMLPNLKPGEYVWASKWNLGIAKKAPKRGDLVIFKLPQDNATKYVMRVIGLPGDRIQIVAGHLNLNSKPVGFERQSDVSFTDSYDSQKKAAVFKETLPDGTNYLVYDLMPDSPFDNTDIFMVPPGHYFMMGDNRDNSNDSRANPVTFGGVGFVPAENLVGHVVKWKTTPPN